MRDSPGGGVATCLRAVGDDSLELLGPVRDWRSAFDVLRIGATGFEPEQRLSVGATFVCPELARAGGVTALAAAVSHKRYTQTVRALVSDGSTVRALTVGRTQFDAGSISTAVSPRGEVLLAWAQQRGYLQHRVQQRIVTRRIAPGGILGPLQGLSPWQRDDNESLATAYDGAGNATVAWSQPIPARGRAGDLYKLQVASGAEGGPLGPATTVVPAVQEPQTLALAVAPNGRALLAHDGSAGIGIFERPALGGAFERRRVPGLRDDRGATPGVALLDDGGGLITWRDQSYGEQDEGRVWISVRPPGVGFGRARIVDARMPPRDRSTSSLFFTSETKAPLDGANLRLRTALAPDGRFSLAWTRRPGSPFGDDPVVARAVAGSLGGALGRATTISCRCRTVNGVAALTVGGEPAAAFTDNRSNGVFGRFELPSRAGRLHLWTASAPYPRSRTPRLTVTAPRRQVLRWRDPLRLRARCSSACDLRGTLAQRPRRGERLRALGTASLSHAGTTWLSLRSEYGTPLMPPHARKVRVAVRAYARNGVRAPAIRRLWAAAERKPLPELSLPFDARVRRAGHALVVTWRYPARPASVSFLIEASRGAHRYTPPSPRLFGYRNHNRRGSYRVVLRPRARDRVRIVELTVSQPGRSHSRKLVLPIPPA